MAKTRGVAVDYVLEMASLDVFRLGELEEGDVRSTLANFVRAAQGIAHDHYLEQIEPWDDRDGSGPYPPAESEGGDSD